MAGYTKEGLKIKRLPEILDSLKSKAEEVFGDLVDPNDVVDTSDSSAIGRIIGIVGEQISDLWQALQESNWAYDPANATGKALDNLVALGDVQRRTNTPTVADVYLVGDTNLTLPAGSSARSTVTGNLYSLARPVTWDASSCIGIGVTVGSVVTGGEYKVNYKLSNESLTSTITVPAEAGETSLAALDKLRRVVDNNHPKLQAYVEGDVLFIRSRIEFQLCEFSVETPLNLSKVISVGEVRGSINDPLPEPEKAISRIATPFLGWDAIWNPFAATTGQKEETDAELRKRYNDTKFARATNIIESLYSSLYALNGVEEVNIIENNSDTQDEYGNPPHSFLVIVEGGLESSIAREVWRNRPVGIRSNGSTAITIIDAFGFLREEKFSRPTYQPVKVEIKLEKGADFPQDGEEQIANNIMKWVGSAKIGMPVVYSRLYSPINMVQGHEVVSLKIGKQGSTLESQNVVMEYNEKATIARADIVFV